MKTPYYEFDQNRFKKKYSQYAEYAKVYYPCKVNSRKCVINLIKDSGGCFEVDSIQMIKYLLNDCQVDSNKILYNYPQRSYDDIKTAIRYGIRLFAVDSIQNVKEIEKIGTEYNSKIAYMLRLSIKDLLPPNMLPISFVDKWGASLKESLEIINFLQTIDIHKLYGISFYYPQEYNNINTILLSVEKIYNIFLRNLNCVIDIGGGISIDNIKKIVAIYPELLGRIVIEPGRHLVGDCFNMICEVVGLRLLEDEPPYIFLNVGIYSGLIDIVIKKHQFAIEPYYSQTSVKCKYVVCGCTSDIADQLGTYSFCKSAVKKGALFRIKNCGAYCTELHTLFSGHMEIEII